MEVFGIRIETLKPLCRAGLHRFYYITLIVILLRTFQTQH